MIIHLKGSVIHKEDKFLVLETNGIGYKIFGTFEMIEGAEPLKEKNVWIHHAVREDTEDLFGFNTKDELDFFELLISISGIGPRGALGILNVTTVGALKRAVASGDTSHLTKVSGIGKKTAEKIVLELKDKFAKEDVGTAVKEEIDALEALKSLGYSHNDAREALKSVTATDTNAKIREALKTLGR